MEKIIIFLFGLAWGSFLNVVIYRLPRGKSIVWPPSSCPHCGRRIRWFDNIPIVSFFWLKGKCRFCRQPISWVYPLVETLTAALFLLLSYRFDLSFSFFAAAIFTTALIILGFIDLSHQVLPDEITVPLFLLSVVYSLFRPGFGLREALLGAIVGSGFLFVVYAGYFWLRKKEGLGIGDITMMLGVGAFLGWRATILTLILASFAGALVGITLLARSKKNLQFALPFGSFLAPAAFVSFLWGNTIISWYLSLFSLPS